MEIAFVSTVREITTALFQNIFKSCIFSLDFLRKLKKIQKWSIIIGTQ